MSYDNFLAIIQEPDGSFTAYDCSASMDWKTIEDYRNGEWVFNAADVEEAVRKAEFYRPCEYGYHFVSLSTKVSKEKAVKKPKKHKMMESAPEAKAKPEKRYL
jgi:hypothetical protein